MKNFKKWLPVAIIALFSLLCTSCKVDWTTVSAVETNKAGVVFFWILVHVIIPAALFIGFMFLLAPESMDLDIDFSVGARVVLGITLVGVYVFHFFYIKSPWFNLLCLTQLGFLALTFIIYANDEDSLARPIVFSLSSAGIIIVSLLANIITGKYLEPFVFSCAGWLTIIAGAVAYKIRDDMELGAELITPVLCFAAMIFGVVHAKVPNYCYMISIQCAIITVLSAPFMLLETKKVLSFVVSGIGYIWVFVTANLYNPESFGKSFGISFIGWAVIIAGLVVAYIIGAKENAKKEAARAAYNEQQAAIRAEAAKKAAATKAAEKAKEEAEAKAKAEAEAKAKEEAEAKAKAEAEAKAKAEAEEKAKKFAETQAVLSQMESDLEAKKAELATLGLDAQGIVRKAALNKEIKELELQIETLKAEVEKKSK